MIVGRFGRFAGQEVMAKRNFCGESGTERSGDRFDLFSAPRDIQTLAEALEKNILLHRLGIQNRSNQ